jgi:hypothetical protein
MAGNTYPLLSADYLITLQLGQSVALFVICLMDHWVDIITSTRIPSSSIYVDQRARYGIGLCILYFCASVMALDIVLSPYWQDCGKKSEEKLSDANRAVHVEREWQWYVTRLSLYCLKQEQPLMCFVRRNRRRRYLKALLELFSKFLLVLGVVNLLLWLLVENQSSILLYWLYIVGYTGVMIFQVSLTNLLHHPFADDLAAYSLIAVSRRMCRPIYMLFTSPRPQG